MKEKNEKRQTAIIWFLTLLVIILTASLIVLLITFTKANRQEIIEQQSNLMQNAQTETKNESIISQTIGVENVDSKYDKLTKEIAEKDKTINNLENEISELKKTKAENNNIIEEIIAKAEESIRYPLFSEGANENKAVACKVKKIEIYDAEYMQTVVNSYDNKVKDYENVFTNEFNQDLNYKLPYFRNVLKKYSSNLDEIPIVGNITFMIEYENNAEGYWMGSGPTFLNGKYAIGSREFVYNKGELTLNTGGTFEGVE